METQSGKRIRIEVSTSVKGVKAYSCTVELSDEAITQEQALAEHDALVKALDTRYPAPQEAKP